jgi:hypothetical protein
MVHALFIYGGSVESPMATVANNVLTLLLSLVIMMKASLSAGERGI